MGCLALIAAVIISSGCDDKTTTSAPEEEQAISEGPVLQLVVPAHDTTPAVELTFQIATVDDGDLNQLREPVGNVIYLAIRDCTEAHPQEDSDEIRAAALNFSVRSGDVEEVEQREAKLRQDRARHVSESGYTCLLREVDAQSVDLSEEWSGVELDVSSQVEMYW